MTRRNPANLAYGFLECPVGPLLVAGTEEHLHRISFATEQREKSLPGDWKRDDALFAEAFRQLRAYFAGELTRFDLPLHFSGTDFQNSVWSGLCEIAFGETISYAALASRIGKPSACRAVGGANGANRLPIVVPCHRVIGSDQSLTGFGGGIAIKRLLLEHERAVVQGQSA